MNKKVIKKQLGMGIYSLQVALVLNDCTFKSAPLDSPWRTMSLYWLEHRNYQK